MPNRNDFVTVKYIEKRNEKVMSNNANNLANTIKMGRNFVFISSHLIAA